MIIPVKQMNITLAIPVQALKNSIKIIKDSKDNYEGKKNEKSSKQRKRNKHRQIETPGTENKNQAYL